MILKSYIKKHGYVMNDKQQSHLGRNVSRSFFNKFPNKELNKVAINSKGIKMEVLDYPREYFESKEFIAVLSRYISKNSIRKQKLYV
jgi:hypothetical protein